MTKLSSGVQGMVNLLFNKTNTVFVFFTCFFLTLAWSFIAVGPKKVFNPCQQINPDICQQKKIAEKGLTECFSFWLITILIEIIFFCHNWPWWPGMVGSLLIILSLVLNYLARRHNPYFGIGEPAQGMSIVVTGPYRWVRHPIYLAEIIRLFGLALVFSSYSAFFMAIFVARQFSRLAHWEEEELIHDIPEYEVYQQKTKNKIFLHI